MIINFLIIIQGKIMINFNNKKTKRWFTGILIMILIVAMVVPMVVYLIP